jgi:hypothetical protein
VHCPLWPGSVRSFIPSGTSSTPWAWQIQLASPQAQIRLETRPRRGVHLDLLVRLDGLRTAIELKYLVADLHATADGELFDLPHQSANDISRHDMVKDITRIEAAPADEHADSGCVLLLSNDGTSLGCRAGGG